MSYAAVAAQNAPPPSQQPHPDPALLNTEADAAEASAIADDTTKVGVVSHDFKEHPSTVTSNAPIVEQYPEAPARPSSKGKTEQYKREAQHLKGEAARALHKAEDEGFALWSLLKEQILRPGVAGGLIGVVNIGLIGTTGYAYYTQPHLRRDPKTIGSTVAAALAVIGVEGYGAAQVRATPAGRDAERKAREEGDLIYRYLREHILRPGVLGGLVGVANVGILGSVGYLAYREWDRRTWDRRYVSAITTALLVLWSGEGYIAEQYREGNIEPPKP